MSTFSLGCSKTFFYPSLGQAKESPETWSATWRDEAISSIHTLLSVSALQLTYICDTLCCSQPSLSPGIVKDPLDVSQFISAANRHETDKLLARVREKWQREFAEELFSNPKLRKLMQTLALGDEHNGMWSLFPAVSLQWTSCPVAWQFTKTAVNKNCKTWMRLKSLLTQSRIKISLSLCIHSSTSAMDTSCKSCFPCGKLRHKWKITFPSHKPTLRNS